MEDNYKEFQDLQELSESGLAEQLISLNNIKSNYDTFKERTDKNLKTYEKGLMAQGEFLNAVDARLVRFLFYFFIIILIDN